MSRCARAFALAGYLVGSALACARPSEGLTPPGRAEAPPPFAVAPEFKLPDSTGELRSLADLTGPRGLILVIYRGHW